MKGLGVMERGRKKSAGLTDEEGNGCPTLSWQFAKKGEGSRVGVAEPA